MEGLIIYKGKYGATRQYAAWAGEMLGFSVMDADKAIADSINKAGVIVLGTSVYIGKLQIAKWVRKYARVLQNRKVYMFLVAGTPPDQTDKLDAYVQASLPVELKNKIQVTYLPGRLHIAGLSWRDRFMLKMGARLTKDLAEKKRMLTDYDYVEKSKLLPMVNKIKEYIGSVSSVHSGKVH